MSNLDVQISIPVNVGGYTGQRDEWEALDRQFAVIREGDVVHLSERQAPNRCVTFALSDLQCALTILDSLENQARVTS